LYQLLNQTTPHNNSTFDLSPTIVAHLQIWNGFNHQTSFFFFFFSFFFFFLSVLLCLLVDIHTLPYGYKLPHIKNDRKSRKSKNDSEKGKNKKKKNNNNNLKKKVRQWYGVDYIFKNVLLLLKKDCSAPRR